MKTRHRRLVVAISAAAVFAGSVAAPVSAAEEENGTPIAYSETYLRYIALFPAGWASNGCVLAVELSGGSGVCTTEIAPVWFYPDGAVGLKPWVIDPSSPTGWSIPSLCEGVTVPDWDAWAAFVDGTNYPDLGIEAPALTDEQVECGIWTYGWWF